MDKEKEIKSLKKIAALFGTTPEELLEIANKPTEGTNKFLEEDLRTALSSLSPRERDVLRLRFGLDDGRKRTLEEVGVLFGVSSYRIRQIEANAIKKLKEWTKNNATLKTGDIINVSLKMTPQIPEEDEDKFEINLYDYPINYSISYDYLDSGFTDLSFTEDAGCSSFSDIKDYLEQYLTDDIKEIDEYEIFDVDNVGEYQTAKIKVKSVKG